LNIPPRWRSVPVYICSTLLDMQAERDWLRAHVIPVLEERLRARRCHLETVDLRWGIDTMSEDAEQAKELIVLKVCLDEIARCRPFVIALVGDRYGWVPPPERMQRAVDEAGFATDIEGKSITHLQIEFGVLDNPDQSRGSHVYLRAPLPYDQMPLEVAEGYSNAHSPDPEVRAGWRRLQALKARIEQEMPGRVRHYSAQWDTDRTEVVGLEGFGQMVLEDLWQDLEAEVAAIEGQPRTWLDEERRAVDEFAELVARDFVGREEMTADLLAPARFPAEEGVPWAACVTGEAGSGKSALLAHVARLLVDDAARSDEDLLVLSQFVGVTPRSVSVDGLLLRWCSELAEFVGEVTPVEEGAPAEDLEQAFASLLGRAALQRRVVVLLDGLDQFEPTKRGLYLTWLPTLWPENARLVASAIPCTGSAALLERPGAMHVPLQPLRAQEAEEIARLICRRYHRTLHPEVLAALSGKRLHDGTSAAGNPLWLRLAVEELNLLDEDDFERADREFTGSGDERLHHLLLSVVAALPPDIEGLYQCLFTRTEQVLGETWARDFADLVVLSRGGWRESDLEEMLPKVSGEAWDPARFAKLRRSFRGHLVRRGAHGQWDFANVQARLAIERRSLTDEAKVRNLHSLIADHLAALPRDDPLHESETMFHLLPARDLWRAAHYCGGELTDGELAGATQRLAEYLVERAREERRAASHLLRALLTQAGTDAAVRRLLAQRYVSSIDRQLEDVVSPHARDELLTHVHSILADILSSDPNDAESERWLNTTLVRHAGVLRAVGDLTGALQHYRSAAATAERLARRDPADSYWQEEASLIEERLGDALVEAGDVAAALRAYEASVRLLEGMDFGSTGEGQWLRDSALRRSSLAQALYLRGDLQAAAEAQRAALDMLEKTMPVEPSSANRSRHSISLCQERLGITLERLGAYAEAHDAYARCLALREELTRDDPANARWQRDLAVAHGRVGDLCCAEERWTDAAEHYGVAQVAIGRLSERDPMNMEWVRDLLVAHERIGSAQRARSRHRGTGGPFPGSVLGRALDRTG